MTTAYRVGADLERAIVLRARADGALAWRVAGSKGEGATDIVIASMWTGLVALNVKRGRWAPPAERAAMVRLAEYGVLPVLVMADVRQGVTTQLLFQDCALELGDATLRAPWTAAWLER
jgi:hypothetical protein